MAGKLQEEVVLEGSKPSVEHRGRTGIKRVRCNKASWFNTFLCSIGYKCKASHHFFLLTFVLLRQSPVAQVGLKCLAILPMPLATVVQQFFIKIHITLDFRKLFMT